MGIKRWLYKTIKGLYNKMLLKNIFCIFLGHKVDNTVLAYRIKSYDTLYDIKIYEVSKCSRCNKIYEKLIDWYQSYGWYIEFAIRQKEKEFREQHIMPISEAYMLLKENMKKKRDLSMTKNKAEQYCKLPIPITAYQADKEMTIHTLEGDHHASIGDWIITGVKGEQYPCKPDIFAKTYIKCGQANKMEQIAAIFGKKLNEEFTIKYEGIRYRAYFKKSGIRVYDMYYDLWDSVLIGLLTGEATIVG